MSEAICKLCLGKGHILGEHLPGYTHYETDAGEGCPAYHYKRSPCICVQLTEARTALEAMRVERDGLRLSVDARHALLSAVTQERDALVELLRKFCDSVSGVDQRYGLQDLRLQAEAALAPRDPAKVQEAAKEERREG